ncbi:cytochrome P450 9b1 [Culex quinquefasciatus]|uniref:Cytochrome P450 9b1 n=1 Tax=Culex quinquefasciatus TaxID=7176 RepID=B0WTQ3_CULQU|nr:cytochrome P450 9e2-like [Culex pipiens pallens]EDS34511.1 cytochrome P450 9b1 [Culex quinquefasciatus]|eukprot:XP_001855241.1 cytochrome P450 9b1 [Culex quinquefasciatus]
MQIDVAYLCAGTLIAALIYYLLTKSHDYFHNKPIPSMAVTPFLGSTGRLMLKCCSFPDFIESIYNKYSGAKVFGLFDTMMPMFVLRDPELIKLIAIKDFEYFIDHRPVFGASDIEHPNLIATKTLFTLTGQHWKRMRSTLSPAFTGVKMKQMFELVVECSESMIEFYRKKGAQEYDMKDLFSRFANDVIATCAFGIKVDSSRNRENEFYKNGLEIANFTSFKMLMKLFGFRLFPDWMARFGIDMIGQEQSDFFSKLIKDAIKSRESGVVRPDMIHLLLQARQGMLKHQQQEVEQNAGFAAVEESEIGRTHSTHVMTENEMIGQCFFFFLAGFDTVSTALTFLAYELALNPDVQEKLRKEVEDTNRMLNGGSLTYDSLHKMTYLDMVLSESLRMWPPASAVDRYCVKDYVLDDGQGLKFTIEKGAGIWLPIQGIHHDPRFYNNPKKFDPERFNEKRRLEIQPGTYMPFGIGSRNCIGSRFALMEVKCIMYYLLLNFTIERCNNTTVPPTIVKGFSLLATEKPIIVKLLPK